MDEFLENIFAPPPYQLMIKKVGKFDSTTKQTTRPISKRQMVGSRVRLLEGPAKQT